MSVFVDVLTEHLLGTLDSGTPDLAERHREYVLESLRRER